MTAAVSRRNTPDKALLMGMWLVIAASCMMFTGLTSAYVASQGLGPAWQQLSMRPLVMVDTAILLFSSATIEHARRRVRRESGVPSGLLVTLALGLAFLAGQLTLFHQMGEAGYYLNTGRQSSFFYVLTTLHGLHVVAGIMAIAWVAGRLRRSDTRRDVRMKVVSLFWHFMGALWLWLLVVLYA